MTWETIGLLNPAEPMTNTSFGNMSYKTMGRIMQKFCKLLETKEPPSNSKFNSSRMWLTFTNPWTSRNSPREPGPLLNWANSLDFKMTNGIQDATTTVNYQSWEYATNWPLKETDLMLASRESPRTVMRTIWCWDNGNRATKRELLSLIQLTFDYIVEQIIVILSRNNIFIVWAHDRWVCSFGTQ